MTKPRLAIEIGRAEGGSLRRIATHSRRVVSLDLVEPYSDTAAIANVRALTGDSHVLLPLELARIDDAGEMVDFVLVDGDHSTDGVRSDVEQLLNSPAVSDTVILVHDTLNEDVRHGLEQVDYNEYEHVAWVDLDFIPGYVARIPERFGECWGGVGLIVVDSTGAFRADGPRRMTHLFEQSLLIWPAARSIRAKGPIATRDTSDLELVASSSVSDAQAHVSLLAADLQRHRAWLDEIQHSASWRLTSPLRSVKRALTRR
ncbi:MAG TPA: class I SAM-dependent methyltransferase [Solirubrobacteraceae bacterium]|nr:class I SAM-dependent methyltransferase [Solirubrobacteraceae bacterium]